MFKLLMIIFFSFVSLNAKMLVGQNIPIFKLKDQFNTQHSPMIETKTIIFAFKKDTGHMLNKYFDQFKADYLTQKNALYVADVSAMPAVIRFFVLGDLVEYKFPILFIEDEDVSKRYKHKDYEEKIVVVGLKNLKITNIQYLTNTKELKKIIDG